MNVGAWILSRTSCTTGAVFRALTIVDDFSRKSLAIYAGKSLNGSDVFQVIEIITMGNKVLPKHVKVDNGSEFISKVFDN